ncbi:MAG: hypothetical protein R6V07_16655 [Armatimonadota bacterium]
MTGKRQHLIALGLSSIPLVRFGFDAKLGLDHLLHDFLVDDAFYYFVIARHVPYFNEGIATSGFHPLYALLVAPLHQLLDPEMAIYGSLLLLVIAYCLGALVLYHLLDRLWRQPIPALCVALWVTSPMLYKLTMTGTETILAVLMVLLFYLQLVAVREKMPASVKPLELFIPGVTAGLAFWARMDSVLFLGPGLLWVIYKLIRHRSWRGLSAFVLPALGISGAWLGYITWMTGEPFPTSGTALRILRGVEDQLIVPLQMIKGETRLIVSYLPNFVVTGRGATFDVALILTVVILAGIGAHRLKGSHLAREMRGSVWFGGLVIAGTALWASYYVLHQGMFRLWYMTYFAVMIFSVVAPLVWTGLHAIGGRLAGFSSSRWLWSVALLVVGAGMVLSEPFWSAPQEYDKYHAALAANRLLDDIPADARIGSFNTGIFNFVMSRDVINLDGVVNPEVHEHLRNETLSSYMARRNIRYLIDHDRAVSMGRALREPGITIEKLHDLTLYYEPYHDEHVRKTFLWTVRFNTQNQK